MFSASDLIEALRGRRRLKSIRPEVAGQLPPGWQAWLEAMPQRPGKVIGASNTAILAVVLQQPLRQPPPRGVYLNRWQAFATVWRQQWHPASRDERWIHILGMVGSLLLHLILTVMLAWLMYVRFMAPRAPAADSVVQVEYIGDGTPETPGGPPLPSPREQPRDTPAQPADASAATQAPATPEVSRLDIEPSAPQVDVALPVPTPEITEPQPSPPVARQPLEVTRVPQPDIEFVLPPTIAETPQLPRPVPEVPELRVPAPQVETVQVPEPVPAIQAEIAPDITQPRISVPELRRPAPALTERAIPEPVQSPETPTVQAAPVAQPSLPAPRVSMPELQVPAPATAAAESDASEPDAGESTAQSPASSTAPAVSATEDNTTAPPADGTTSAPVAGVGPEPTPREGGWPTPTRSDDWGDALDNRPGGESGNPPGLFDDSGRPRLADTPGQPPGGAPPGSTAQQAIDLDRAGDWLRRPPYDYEPTIFDDFWVPSENLLEEWVRKGIKDVSIPIPGTSKSINCVVSLLQLGGGCMLSDDNLNNQPANARPPPDVPFKPELQENQDSLRQDAPAPNDVDNDS